MKELTKNVEGDKSPDKLSDTNKGTSKATVSKSHVSVNNDNTKSGKSSTYKNLTSSSPKGTHENKTAYVDKRVNPNNKKDTLTEEKMESNNFSIKGKTEGENRIQKEAGTDNKSKSKEETENANSGNKHKKKLIIIKKNAKKAEEKVDKLKKKVKKAIKKDVKISKLKGLNEKFKEAFGKLMSSIKKLKKAKK